ncbi:MAG: outer membrane protein assembly factor BamE [Burkholderiaceae bacterium]
MAFLIQPPDIDTPMPDTRIAPVRRAPRAAGVALVLVLAGTTLLGACASRDTSRSGIFEPHRIDLPQGNYVTGEMLERVQPGMSPAQVRFALGSPLLVDVFRPDRWNYVFRYLHANGDAELRKVVIVFENERVARIDADPLPRVEDPSDPALPGYRPDGGA